ncbi:hypothetical protein ACLQ3C_20655 [Gordonia sp. DT30]|uniref:hypothetical protein n=1 Tax=Gordonia sp. DT30 TaxID=3416546 RepID=UPI003CEF97CE
MSDFWMRPEFSDAADRFDEAASSVSGQASGLDGGGHPWGEDKLGNSFSSKFMPDLDQVLTNLSNMATKLGDEGEAVTRIAGSVTRADQGFGG